MHLKKQTFLWLPIFGVFFFFTLFVNGQNQSNSQLLFKIDSIRNQEFQIKQTKSYVDLLNELAKNYRYRNADSIKLLSDEAIAISSESNYSKGKAFGLIRRGDYYSDTGQEKKAFEVYKKARSLAYSLNYPELKVEVLKSIATQEFLSQNLNNAVLTFYAAIDLASINELYEQEARLRHNLGYCYYNYKLYDEAQIEYLVADSLWAKIKSEDHLKAMTTSNIALNAIDQGNLDIGILYIDKSISLLQKKSGPLWLSRAFRTKTKFFMKKGNFRSARKMIISSDSLLSQIYNPRDQMEIDIIRSRILIALGELNKAKKYSLKSLEKAIEFKDSIFQVQSYENLEKIQELTGQTDSAYAYYKKGSEIKTILKENDKIQNIALLRAKINFDKEKESIRLENLKASLTQQKYAQWTTAGLIGTICVAFIVYKSSRREKQLNKQLNERTNTLVESETQLKDINTNQKKLFSIVGHDLKGPIATLRELLRLMANEKNKEIILQSLLPKLNKYTDHVYFTVDNLLSWGQKQMKGATSDPNPVNLHEVMTGILALFSEGIRKKKLRVDLEIDKKIEAWVDINDIEVVFRNLINNAIKFSHPDSQIKICAVQKDKEIVLQFKDQGVGMSEKIKKVIFEENSHYSTAGTNNEKGTGMGLMLSKELLLRNKGKIEVESTPNVGTNFIVYLPTVL